MKQPKRPGRFGPASLFGALLLCLTGCHSHWVEMTIVNRGPAVRLLELDYPSASFGVDTLPAAGQYHYRFKIQGSGPLTLQFQDAAGKNHSAGGPQVNEGEEGAMTVTIDAQNQVGWTPHLIPSR